MSTTNGVGPIGPAGGVTTIAGIEDATITQWLKDLNTKLNLNPPVKKPELIQLLTEKKDDTKFMDAFKNFMAALKTASQDEIKALKNSGIVSLASIRALCIPKQQATQQPGTVEAPKTSSTADQNSYTVPDSWKPVLSAIGIKEDKITSLKIDLSKGLSTADAKKLGMSDTLIKLIANDMDADLKTGTGAAVLDIAKMTKLVETLNRFTSIACLKTPDEAYEIYNKTLKFKMINPSDVNGAETAQAAALKAFNDKFSDAATVSSDEFLKLTCDGRDTDFAKGFIGSKTTIESVLAKEILKKEIAYTKLIKSLPDVPKKIWLSKVGLGDYKDKAAPATQTQKTETDGTEKTGETGNTGAPKTAEEAEQIMISAAETLKNGTSLDASGLAQSFNIDISSVDSFSKASTAFKSIAETVLISLLLKDLKSFDSSAAPKDALEFYTVILSSISGSEATIESEVVKKYMESQTFTPTDDDIVKAYNSNSKNKTKIKNRSEIENKTIGGKKVIDTYTAIAKQTKLISYLSGFEKVSSNLDFSKCGSMVYVLSVFNKAKSGAELPQLSEEVVNDIKNASDKENWLPRLALIYYKQNKKSEAEELLKQTDVALSAKQSTDYKEKFSNAGVYLLMYGVNSKDEYLKKAAKICKEIWPDVKILFEKTERFDDETALIRDYISLVNSITKSASAKMKSEISGYDAWITAVQKTLKALNEKSK